jgi:hypothetical protein
VDDPLPNWAAYRFRELDKALTSAATTPIAKRLAHNIAACAAGFEVLGRVVGVELGDAALQHGLFVLGEIATTLEEDGGESGADRLYNAILEAEVTHPELFLIGPPHDLRILRYNLLEVARKHASIDDPDPFLRDLVRDGRLLRGEDKNIQKNVRMTGGKVIRAYVFQREDAVVVDLDDHRKVVGY